MGYDAAYRSIIYNQVVLKQNEMPTGAPEEERLMFLPHGGRRCTPRLPHLTLYPFSSSYIQYTIKLKNVNHH